MAQLVASAKISAQETTPGQAFSTAFFARITVSNPSPARDLLSDESFSASSVGTAIRADASAPCNQNK